MSLGRDLKGCDEYLRRWEEMCKRSMCGFWTESVRDIGMMDLDIGVDGVGRGEVGELKWSASCATMHGAQTICLRL